MEKRKDDNQRMFPKFWEAVEAMAKCCDTDTPVLARSEVYNETWMLRLMLARIYDFSGDFKIDKQKKKALDMIRNAVKKHWISEGGLEPAFTKEGTTWADAILGDVELGEYDDSDGDKRKVRLIKPSSGGKYEPCVVVIEAKMGSSLSKSVTNSSDYDQAARNIACLAKLLLDSQSEESDGAFFVFTPEKSNRDEANKLINKAIETINNQTKSLPERKSSARDYKGIDKEDKEKQQKFQMIVRRIINSSEGENLKPEYNKSMVLTWDEILNAMNNEEDCTLGIISDTQKLRIFYEKSLKEISKQSK